MTYKPFTFTVDHPAAIHTILLTDADVPVEVLSSGDGRLYATYFESEKETYDIEVDDGTLYIRKRVSLMAGLFRFRSEPEHVKITLYLPDHYNGSLSIATVDGDIRVYGVSASDLTVKTTDGDISVNRTHINGAASCKTTDGDITVGSITAAEASLKTTDGDILLDRPLVSGRITARTTDGGIKGLLAGRDLDYSFSVRVVDGRSNVRSGGNGRTLCELKTVDGNIDVSFEDRG